jgi:hypothetical protein
MFIIVFFLIYGYNRCIALINTVFLNERVIQYIKNNKILFNKILYILLEIFRWINPLVVVLVCTDTWLYQLNRYITGTRFIRYNFIVYVLAKYILMFGLLKLIIYKYYNFWDKLFGLTIVDILFKRMYGLILSILIFSDLFNYILNILSYYNILIYVCIYYVISILCVIWELLYFYYLNEKVVLRLYKIGYEKTAYLIFLFDQNFQSYTKMYKILFYRNQYTWIGRIAAHILKNLVPDISQKTNFKEEYISLEKFSDTSYFMSGRILYFKPLENRLSFKYFKYFGGYLNFSIFESTFKLYWECYKSALNYYSFFNIIREIKGRPSIFLYKQLQDIANLYDVFNQPINRFMNWMYFDIKFNEYYDDFDEIEKFYIKRSLNYLMDVDDLRAKLMYFIIWDIEYYYSKNKDNYKNNLDNWNYWKITDGSLLDKLIFIRDERYNLVLLFNNSKITNYYLSNKDDLKFYDPEENMEFLNRLFDVLGILVNLDHLKEQYYVSAKFKNCNERFVELSKIMYSHNFYRIYENRCNCSLFSLYEVRIAYRTEAYFQNLRKEWLYSIENEKLEDRNWSLLKSTEDLMEGLNR